MATSPGSVPISPINHLLLNFDHVAAGVPLETLTGFLKASGLHVRDMHDVVLPARTLKHRRQKHQTFTRDESDKLARVVRIFNHAVQVFGDLSLGREWMTTPKSRFDQQTPLALLATEVGGMRVEEMLWQIDEGMFA